MAQSKKVIPMNRRFQPSVTWFIFLLVFAYIVFLLIGFFSQKHISIYEVNTSQISDDTPMYGIILRNEKVINTPSEGYINYYNAEGSRVGPGDVIYTLDQNGEVSSALDEIQSTQNNSQSISAMREVISSFYNAFSMSNYTKVSDFSFDVNNVIFESNNDNLYSQLNRSLKESGQNQNVKKIKAQESGVISYSIDGYESITKDSLNKELLNNYGKSTRKRIQNTELAKADSPAYKIVTDNQWTIAVILNDEDYKALDGKTSLRVTIDRDNISFNASLELLDQDGVHFALLTTSRYMERYINDRFLKIEFNLKSASGLKIPNSSILSKDFSVIPSDYLCKTENGVGVLKQITNESGKSVPQITTISNYFVQDKNVYIPTSIISKGDTIYKSNSSESCIVSDPQPLEGVYCVNEGYCQFRYIEKKYQNNEYTIVAENSSGGLSAYDHIVVDPSSLGDDDFIQ